MQGAGYQLFTGTRLALNQHRCMSQGNLANTAKQFFHGRTTAYHAVHGLFIGVGFGLLFALLAPGAQRVLDGIGNFFAFKGYRQIIHHGTVFGGFQC